MIWNKVEEKLPEGNTWVVGLCKLTAPILKDHDPVVFQVKYQKHCGWSDWCGDRESDSDWKVLAWTPMPSEELNKLKG
jgi:hypothetical protein